MFDLTIERLAGIPRKNVSRQGRMVRHANMSPYSQQMCEMHFLTAAGVSSL